MILLTRLNGEYARGPTLILLLPSPVPVRNRVVTYNLTEQKYIDCFHCYTVHVVELLNYYTNHCTYIKFIKFYTSQTLTFWRRIFFFNFSTLCI